MSQESPVTSSAAAISTAVVKLMSEFTGRGPTKARTYFNENLVTVVLQDTLTRGERSLVRGGQDELVLSTRQAFQRTMRDEMCAAVAQITGREVVAFLSANSLDPDIAIESFLLDGSGQRSPGDAMS
ncbi:MAG: hypothetical protein NVSMB51_06040 [Solirubrobacteraceae bacterium]